MSPVTSASSRYDRHGSILPTDFSSRHNYHKSFDYVSRNSIQLFMFLSSLVSLVSLLRADTLLSPSQGEENYPLVLMVEQIRCWKLLKLLPKMWAEPSDRACTQAELQPPKPDLVAETLVRRHWAGHTRAQDSNYVHKLS